MQQCFLTVTSQDETQLMQCNKLMTGRVRSGKNIHVFIYNFFSKSNIFVIKY